MDHIDSSLEVLFSRSGSLLYPKWKWAIGRQKKKKVLHIEQFTTLVDLPQIGENLMTQI